MIGDLAGFAAAVLRRGVGFVQIPTTLLAQVDSSVGGKTGINSPQGKNLIGAFHQPRLVLADTVLLDTLPAARLPRRLRRGGEVRPPRRRRLLPLAGGERPRACATATPRRALHAVRRSCEMKAAIVARDETEEGDRALLNLGHTFAHALEAATGFSERLLHGEAVAIGCQLAFDLSARLGLCPQEAPSRVAAHLAAMGMKRRLADIPGELPGPEALVELMGQDKKVRDGRIAFVLARDIGDGLRRPRRRPRPGARAPRRGARGAAGLSRRLAAVQKAHRGKKLCLARLRFQALGLDFVHELLAKAG